MTHPQGERRDTIVTPRHPDRRAACGWLVTSWTHRRGSVRLCVRRRLPLGTEPGAEPGIDGARARVYPHDGPIRRRACGYILTTDQSDAERVGIFSRRTNQTQGVWVYPHDGPIGRRFVPASLQTLQHIEAFCADWLEAPSGGGEIPAGT
eukprot:9245075-Pyramimonas_sp.AAC.1